MYSKGYSFDTDTKNIKEINDFDELMKDIKVYNYNDKGKGGELSLILIYSPSCPHCINFHPHYVFLAEKFNNKRIHFYQINGRQSNNYQKKLSIRGFPSLWFYYNGTYWELKNNYNEEYIGDLINRKYLFQCDEIGYDKAKTMLMNFTLEQIEDNSLIGIFNNNYTLNAYLDLSTFNKAYIRKCFFAYNSTLNQSIVYSFNRQKGINAFTRFTYLTNTSHTNSNTNTSDNTDSIFIAFNRFIKEKVTRLYLDFKGDKELQLLESIDTDIIIFSYKTQEEKRTYIQLIKDITLQYGSGSMTRYSFVLFDINSNVRTLKQHIFSYTVGIFTSNGGFTNISQISDLDIITKLSMSNNTNTNDVSNITFINKDILKTINDTINSQNTYSWLNQFSKELTYIGYGISYTLIFYLLWHCLLKKIIEEDEANDILDVNGNGSDMEEMKVINEIIDQ